MDLVLLSLDVSLSQMIRDRYPGCTFYDLGEQKNTTTDNASGSEAFTGENQLEEVVSSLAGSQAIIVYQVGKTSLDVLQKIRQILAKGCFIAMSDEQALPQIQSLINHQLIDFLYRTQSDNDDLLLALKSRLQNEKAEPTISETPAEVPAEPIEESIVTAFYIYDLIYGDLDKADRIRKLRHKYGLLAFPNCALTLVVDNFWEICRDLDNKSRYEIKMEYLKLLENFINTCDLKSIACSLVGTDKLIALVHVPMENAEDGAKKVFDLAAALKKYINKHARSTVSIGIGNIYEDSRLIWKSYEESFRALEYTFFIGSDSLIHFEETRNYTTLENSEDQLPNYKYNFFKHINQWSESEITRYYEAALGHLVSKGFNSETIKSIVIKYNFEILDYLEQLNFSVKELNDYVIRFSTQILRSTTMAAIKEINREYIRRVAHAIVSKRQADEVATAIDSAKIFIEKYYYTELSLDLMAQISNLSPAYFSRKFKERTGLNYTQHLEQTRLKKALELLKSSEASLNEVAAAVGFRDYSYFSSRFKKKYGHGPSFYRTEPPLDPKDQAHVSVSEAFPKRSE